MKSQSEIVFENDRFRATKWTIQPGGTIPMHRHEHDYVVIPLSDNLMHVTTADGELIEAALKPGTAYGRDAGSEHENENRGDSDVVFIEVEYLK